MYYLIITSLSSNYFPTVTTLLPSCNVNCYQFGIGMQLLCSVKGTEALFDVEVNKLSVKHSQDQLGSALSCETQIRSHWSVQRAGEESGAIGV